MRKINIHLELLQPSRLFTRDLRRRLGAVGCRATRFALHAAVQLVVVRVVVHRPGALRLLARTLCVAALHEDSAALAWWAEEELTKDECSERRLLMWDS